MQPRAEFWMYLKELILIVYSRMGKKLYGKKIDFIWKWTNWKEVAGTSWG